MRKLMLMFAVLLVGLPCEARDTTQLNELAECPSVKLERSGQWQVVSSDGRFDLELPANCKGDQEAEKRYVHGGQRWQCNNITAEVVWGMWSRDSFRPPHSFCRTQINNIPVMLIRPEDVNGSRVIAWYITGQVHEPLISAWSSDRKDSAVIETIVRSGTTRPPGGD